jgi:hypothetical protein
MTEMILQLFSKRSPHSRPPHAKLKAERLNSPLTPLCPVAKLLGQPESLPVSPVRSLPLLLCQTQFPQPLSAWTDSRKATWLLPDSANHTFSLEVGIGVAKPFKAKGGGHGEN